MFPLIILALLLSATTVTVNGQPPTLPDVNKTIEELYQLIVNGQYDIAVNLTIAIRDTAIPDRSISETVKKLLDSRSMANPNALSFAYKLWCSKAKDVVRMHFPAAFRNILNQNLVKIVNKEYGQALKLALRTDKGGDRRAWGDSHDKTSKRVSWKFIALWENNEVKFKINNPLNSMYLKLGVQSDGSGDKIAYGSNNDDTDRHKFYLEPQNENGELVFFIINYRYCQALKLVVKPDNIGDRALMSHNGELCPNMGRHKWIISAFTTPK